MGLISQVKEASVPVDVGNLRILTLEECSSGKWTTVLKQNNGTTGAAKQAV